MPTAAQYANIQADLDARLASAARIIPIIVVPGVFGTRLATTAGVAVWNPMALTGNDDGSLAMDVEQIRRIDTPLVPMERIVTDEQLQAAYEEAVFRPGDFPDGVVPDGGPGDAEAALGLDLVFSKVTHGGHVIYDYYGYFLEHAALQLPTVLGAGTTAKVYCCGYDWRQSNAVSAGLLATVVEEALDECRAEKCVIVAHSMGGLVTRHYARHLGGESRIGALFLAGSPSLGAIEPYLWLKHGVTSTVMRAAFSGNKLWWDSVRESRGLVRSMPSSYELAPNRIFCEHVAPSFAGFDESKTAYLPLGEVMQGRTFSDNSDWIAFYYDIYVGLQDEVSERAAVRNHTWNAHEFHRGLGAEDGKIYMPPNTYCMYTTDVDTVAHITLPFKAVRHDAGGDFNVVELGDIAYDYTASGDSAVPTGSARPSADRMVRDFVGVHPMSKVEHGDMLNQPPPYAYFETTVKELVAKGKL